MNGVLEPFQTATTLDGQVQELHSVLSENGPEPVALIGFSWGAFLAWIFTARYPALVRKLILVSSPPFEEQYAARITQTRMTRLTKKGQVEVQALLAELADPDMPHKNDLLAKLGTLLARADAYDPANVPDEGFHCQYDVFREVWDEASELREKQILLQMAKMITCPVVAIHGDWDPHPAEGVNDPLAKVLPDFRFVLLEKCGHRPWIERTASENFYKALVGAI
jgi:pimeloyl-ACP methyl ester carboxylesterase